MADHVHEVHRNEPRRDRHLRVGTDAPEVVYVAKRGHHRTEIARPLDEAFHHLRPDPLPKPSPPSNTMIAPPSLTRVTPVFGCIVSFAMLRT